MTKYDNVASVPRERKSVPILGIDRSTPDDLVEDGKCAELNNLRYKDGAWRGVSEYKKVKLPDGFADEYEVVYHHPAAGENTLIASLKDEPELYYLIDFSEEGATPEATLIGRAAYDAKIFHFGNVLIFYLPNNSIVYYIYQNKEYKPFTPPHHAITEISASAAAYSLHLPTLAQTDEITSYGDYKWEDAIYGGSYHALWYPIYNITQGYSCIKQGDKHWSGEMLLFTTWLMDDGTPLAPSPLHLAKSNGAYRDGKGYNNKIGIHPHPKDFQTRYAEGRSTNDIDQYLGIYHNAPSSDEKIGAYGDPSLRSWLPELKVRIAADANTEHFKTIAIWCTRVLPIFSPEGRLQHARDNFRQDVYKSSNSYVDYYADNDLANQPFYLLKEIPVRDFKKEEGTDYLVAAIPLPYSELSQVIHNRVYTPISSHTTIPDCTLDYNNRLHLGGGKTILTDSYSLADSEAKTSESRAFNQWVEVQSNDNLYRAVSSCYKVDTKIKEGSAFEYLISYPDYRATRFAAEEHCNLLLKEAMANNIAWYYQPHTEAEKFPPIEYNSRINFDSIPADFRIIEHPSTVRVSETNNHLLQNFANVYSFGSSNNRVLAMQSAAMQIADEKTGDLPLIVFTTEGIYALRAGAETLYARTDALNYDKVINPNTLAVKSGIIYITEKGVHFMRDRESIVISTPIHDINGVPPLSFLRECKLIFSKQYNEVILFNEESEDGRAYIYNLDNGYWSTRDLTGKKINTDVLVKDNTIFDLTTEDAMGASLRATLSTRPIKLGDVEFKRIESIIPRMSTGATVAMVDFNLSGSTDGSNYLPLRTWNGEIDLRKVNPLVLRRTPFSAKYFKVAMTFEAEIGERLTASITHFDIEWYRRFRRRML
jgi:hypothetical protein